MGIYIGDIVEYIGYEVFEVIGILGVVVAIDNRHGTQEKIACVKFENGMSCYFWLEDLRKHMTARKFFDMYEGRRVKILDDYRGMIGIVHSISYSDQWIIVRKDTGGACHYHPSQLEVIEAANKIQKVIPLPLPG